MTSNGSQGEAAIPVGCLLSAEDCSAALEAAPVALMVLSTDLVILQASDAYLEATGRNRDDLLGHHIFEAFPDNPSLAGADGVANLRASLERALATGRPDTMAIQRYDVTNRAGTFQPRWWSPINVPVLDGNGHARLALHRVEDVTDFMQAREAGSGAGPGQDILLRRLRDLEGELLARNRELAAANEQVRDAYRRDRARSASLVGMAENIQRSLLDPPPQPEGLD